METMQQTFSGELLTPDEVRELRYSPSVPVYQYLVEFYSGEVECDVWERVKIEEREIAGINASDRANYAAFNQSVYEDLTTLKITKFEQTEGDYTDEWQVEQYWSEINDELAAEINEARLQR